MSRILDALRLAAWRANKRFRLKSLLPDWLRYVDSTSIQFVKDSWPPILAPAPAPYVYWPTKDQRAWFDLVSYFSGRPVVLPPILLHEIKNGILFPDSGTLATEAGHLIQESCLDRALQATQTYDRLRSRRLISMGDTLITSVGIGKYQGSYGHWLLQALPRLWALSLLPEPVWVIVPDTLVGVRRRLLELASPGNVTLVAVPHDRPIRSQRVLLTPFATVNGCGVMRPEVIDYLRTALVSAAQSRVRSRLASPRHIYVSREKAGWSRVANETELKEALRTLGVVSVVAEDLSIEEQILHFVSADLVVGALGSGLINCMFQNRGGTLIEIFAGGLGAETHTPSLNAAGICISSGLDYVPIYHGHRDPEPSYPVDVERIRCTVSGVLQSLREAATSSADRANDSLERLSLPVTHRKEPLESEEARLEEAERQASDSGARGQGDQPIDDLREEWRASK